MESAAREAAKHLDDCYKSLSSETADWRQNLLEHSKGFAAHFVALEQAANHKKRWRIRPKLHLFLELCSEGGRPSLCWTYRDEDFGGSCAHMSRRRGGLLRPAATSKHMLRRFAIKQPMVKL